MICNDCNTSVTSEFARATEERFGVVLCERHAKLVNRIIKEHQTPVEAIQLFYALKEAGANPMLEWWDGTKSVDIAISRVKLNIEIETDYHLITHQQAINDLEEPMHSFKNGFTTIRIPHVVVKYYLEQTVNNILGIVQGLKSNMKVI